ncbi:DEAD/DEAH box helicase family protein, partial [Staphylococcus pseudintermedius]|nr:DEAD/DEAH box helicase family protein [Staphylococcus pseudintermedius]
MNAGSGKSVTMSEVARRATDKGNRVLFCVHRIELVNQIKNTFRLNNVDMDLCHVGMV